MSSSQMGVEIPSLSIVLPLGSENPKPKLFLAFI